MCVEGFMQLLCAQLTHQDPTEPLTSQEMLNQIAQMNTVAQMAQLNEYLQSAAGESVTDVAVLIGKTVAWIDEETSSEVSGNVTKVRLGDSGWEACVGGDRFVPVDSLTSVQ